MRVDTDSPCGVEEDKMGSIKKNQWKLIAMASLNFSYFLVELVVGYLTHSMALVADSFHMLSDVAALVVAYFAVKMSPKKWSKNTYGWARAEVLGAFVNSVFLIALCFTIVVDAIQRIVEPVELKDARLILIVGSIGLLMNLLGLCIFRDQDHSHSHHGHSHRGEEGPYIPVEKIRSTLTLFNRLTRMVSNVEANDTMDDKEKSPAIQIHLCESECNHNQCWDMRVTMEELAKKTVVKINIEESGMKSDHEPMLSEHPVLKKRNSLIKSKMDPRKGGSRADQMNIRGVFLHLLADAMGSVIVVISAIVVECTDWEYEQYIDPCLSISMVVLVFTSVYPLFAESSLILLQSVPEHINLDELEKKLLRQVDGVMGVHDLHVWQLAGDKIIATVHIKCRTLQEYFYIAEKVKAIFHNEGIHSTTIQPEFSQQCPDLCRKEDEGCFLSCSVLSTKTDCPESACYPPFISGGDGNANFEQLSKSSQ